MSSQDHLAEYRFRNPEVDLGVEVLDLERLRERLTPAARGALHRADFHQFFVVTGAAVSATVDFTEHSCPHGAVLHVRPGQVVRLPHGDTDQQTTAVLFTPLFPQQLAPLSHFLGPHGPAVHTIPADRLPAFVRSVEDLAGTYRQAVAGGPVDALTHSLIRQVLGVVLLRMVPDASNDPGADERSAIEVTRRFRSELERAFRATRSASAYAGRLGYSTRTLDRACVLITGHTAKKLIDDRVVLEAKRLLAHTTQPIGALSSWLGFSEQTNFSKYFHRRTGTSPQTFRQANH